MSSDRSALALVQKLRPGTSGEPLYVMPDIGGNFLYSRLMTRHLAPDRPVFGLKLPAVPVAKLALQPMEQLADQLAAALHEANPSGPHHILGHSFAGLLAFETARALERRGSRAGLVAILDTGVPPGWPRRAFGRVKHAVRHARLLRRRPTEVSAPDMVLTCPGYATFHLSNHPIAVRDIIRALYAMMIAYRPAPYSGPVLVLRAALPKPTGRPDLGWSRFVAGSVMSADVAADHLGLVREDAAARQVAEHIEKALQGQ